MEDLKLEINIKVARENELNTDDLALVLQSKEAVHLSFSPYSNFPVGCAIRLENGTIIKGANQENAAFPMCICAEGNALGVVATQYWMEKINDVAIYVSADSPASPCGLCRQSFKEYEVRMKKKFKYYLVSNEHIYIFEGIDTILPLAFSADDLK